MEEPHGILESRGKWLIVAVLLSFGIGVIFFFTIAMQRDGDPIPPDASSPMP